MIEVEDVHFSYPNGVEALKGISLTIKNGEFVAKWRGKNNTGQTL
jgi:ABC-type phosphate/phosphonate transport system ATPase subunit